MILLGPQPTLHSFNLKETLWENYLLVARFTASFHFHGAWLEDTSETTYSTPMGECYAVDVNQPQFMYSSMLTQLHGFQITVSSVWPALDAS